MAIHCLHQCSAVQHGYLIQASIACWMCLKAYLGVMGDWAEAEQAAMMRAGDPWRAWNSVRCLCNHSSKLGALLEVQSEVPPLQEVLRWHGEPVRALLLPTSAFLTNKRGYPTLSRAHQELLTRFFQMGVQVMLPSLQRCGGDFSQFRGSLLKRKAIKALLLIWHGIPILIKAHQHLLTLVLQLRVRLILCPASRLSHLPGWPCLPYPHQKEHVKQGM